MLRETKKIVAAVALVVAASPAWAGDSTAKTAIGGGLGGAGGAAVGGALGGKTGAVVGGAAGGAVGAAATTTGKGRTGAIVGGAVGGGAGAAIGQEVGGKNGAIVGAGVGGAAGSAIGRDLNGGGKQQTKPATVVRAQAVQQVIVEENCGSKKKHKNHPGKGWAKGHNKNC
jgi:hypothetical protein